MCDRPRPTEETLESFVGALNTTVRVTSALCVYTNESSLAPSLAMADQALLFISVTLCLYRLMTRHQKPGVWDLLNLVL